MIAKRHNLKVFNIIAVFLLAATLLTACGGFSFQAQAAPAEDGGVGITGGVDPILPVPDSTEPAPVGQMMNPTVIILLFAGFGVLVLILVLLALRPSANQKSSEL